MSKPLGPYTPVVRAGDWIIVSGQLGIADGALVPGGVSAQTTQAVENLKAQLATAEAGGDAGALARAQAALAMSHYYDEARRFAALVTARRLSMPWTKRS